MLHALRLANLCNRLKWYMTYTLMTLKYKTELKC